MNETLQQVLTFVLIPMAAMIAGGIMAAFYSLGPSIRGGIQHFAAGVVFSAVAVEILPDLLHRHAPVAAIIGFGLGVLVMLGVKALARQQEAPEVGENTRRGRSLVIAVAIDVLIDGLLIGIGFIANDRAGVIITIALTLEMLFLSLSVGAALTRSKASPTRRVTTIGILGLTLAVGAIVGTSLLQGVSGWLMEAILAFGAAALLFLVTEELLVEAHEMPDTPLITSMFFAGFLVLLIIEMLAVPVNG